MGTINDRINEVIKHYNYSVRALSLKFGYSGSSTLNNIVSGKRNKPSFDVLIKFVEEFEDISLDWLLLGRGAMIKNKEVELKFRTVADYISKNHDLMLENEPAYRNWYENKVGREALLLMKELLDKK